MVIDTSAFVAIVLEESSRAELLTELVNENGAIMAAPNALECHMVLTKHFGPETSSVIQSRFREFRIEVVPFGPDHAAAATRAFDQFGKGRHPAALNFGDCIAYALGKVSGQRLLYVGEDFHLTDVKRA